MEQSFNCKHLAQRTHRYIVFSSPITRAAHVPEVAQDIHHGLDAVFSPEHGMKQHWANNGYGPKLAGQK